MFTPRLYEVGVEWERMGREELDERAVAEAAWRLRDYQGDSYIFDELKTLGFTDEEARAEIRDPAFIAFYLQQDYLHEIAVDAEARKTLAECLAKNHPAVAKEMADLLKRARVRGKRGPKPQIVGGQEKHKYEWAGELKQAGKSQSEIAGEMYGNASLENRRKVRNNLQVYRRKMRTPTAAV